MILFHRESNRFLGSLFVSGDEVGSMVDVRDLMVVSCEVDSRFPVVSDRFEYVWRFCRLGQLLLLCDMAVFFIYDADISFTGSFVSGGSGKC